MTYLAKNLANGARELIAFRIGNQEFCVNVMSVREIRGWTPATPHPISPSHSAPTAPELSWTATPH